MAISHSGPFDRPGGADGGLETKCARALERLRALGDGDLLAALADPRPLHKALYADLAPADAPEMAGAYRGADHPSLRDAIVFYAFDDKEGTTAIAGPHRVAELMDQYAGLVRPLDLRRVLSRDEKLALVANLMTYFGAIHPFIDGNGHIQRLTAQCLFERSGVALAPGWRVHPRPYGEDMHRALAAHDMRAVAEKLRGFVI